MTDDLDKLEAIASATEAVHPGPWHGWLYSGYGPVSRMLNGGYATIVHELPEKEDGGEELAEHIAAFSPDVVLALINRVRVAEAATKYLYDKWEDAEGQAHLYVFGPDAKMRAWLTEQDEPVREASTEIQALVRRLCK